MIMVMVVIMKAATVAVMMMEMISAVVMSPFKMTEAIIMFKMRLLTAKTAVTAEAVVVEAAWLWQWRWCWQW